VRIIAICALVALAGCGRDPSSAVDPRVADASRPLVLVTYPTEPPCSYLDESGAIVGTDVDLARRIAAKLGRGLVVEGVPFNDILPRLKAGTADLGIATIIITEARSRDVDFSDHYGEGGACFLYRRDGLKPRMSHIFSFRIAVESDSVHDLYLCLHGCDPIRFASIADAVAALERGDVDSVFFDSIQLKHIAEASGGRLIVTQQETRDRYAVAVDKRRPDVLAAANAVIAEGAAE